VVRATGTGAQGFVDNRGTFTPVNDPGAGSVDATSALGGVPEGTYASETNDLGVVIGWFIDPKAVAHGFAEVRNRFTTINDPNASSNDPVANYLGNVNFGGTYTYGENDHGVVFGEYIDRHGIAHGFTEVRGKFTTLDDPNAGTRRGQGTSVDYVNNRGVVVGQYADSKGVQHGFIDQNGRFSPVNDPKAGGRNGQGTLAEAVTNANVIVGYYLDRAGVARSFLDRAGRFSTLNDPSASPTAGSGTFAAGVPLCP
jgi:hypothetical protein